MMSDQGTSGMGLHGRAPHERPSDRNALIRDPVVILAAPRSGSSALFAALSAHPDLWSRYRESNQLFEGPFDPILTGAPSNALTEDDLEEDTRGTLLRGFFDSVGNLERLPFTRHITLRGRGRRRISEAIALLTKPLKRPPIRIVEKSPKNTFRVPFLRALFPDARFIHLTRDPRGNIASLYRAWQMPGRYKTYPLPPGFRVVGYSGSEWSFVLQPGWDRLDGRTLVEICADQWRACNEACMRDLRSVGPEVAMRVRYEDVVAHPMEALGRIAGWAHLDPAPFERFAAGLEAIQATSKPHPDKWRGLQREIGSVLGQVEDVASTLGYS
jgi:hypothetical protein